MNSLIVNNNEFPNYGADELVEIGKVMCRELEYEMDDETIGALRRYMEKRMTMPFFANARTERNSIDLARMRSAVRVFNEKMDPNHSGEVTEAELCRITPADFPPLEEMDDNSIVA